MKTIHYIQLILGSLGMGLPSLASSFPETAKPFLLMAAAVCIMVSTTLGVVSEPAKPTLPAVTP